MFTGPARVPQGQEHPCHRTFRLSHSSAEKQQPFSGGGPAYLAEQGFDVRQHVGPQRGQLALRPHPHQQVQLQPPALAGTVQQLVDRLRDPAGAA